MPTVTIVEAQARLAELIHELRPGEELVIVENDQPVARLIGEPAPGVEKKSPRLGSMKGSVVYMSPDFDRPLEDFEEYME